MSDPLPAQKQSNLFRRGAHSPPLCTRHRCRYCRQTLLGGNYGLLNRSTYEPNPDYYIARVFHEVMGDMVLQPPTGSFPGVGYLRPYMHCARAGDGVALLLVNVAPNTSFVLTIADSEGALFEYDEYMFTAKSLDSQIVALNGIDLVVKDGELPGLPPVPVTGLNHIYMPPHSIAFFVLKGLPSSACATISLH